MRGETGRGDVARGRKDVAPAPDGILILSNGHGEDAMGALLARELLGVGLSVRAFPVVGEGKAYAKAGVPIVGVQKALPSGGFILESARNLWRDLRAGLLGLTFRQMQALRRLRAGVSWSVAVGDVYVLFLAAYVLKRPVVFLPTAKSEYIRGHFVWEYAMMRRRAARVFPRDPKTAEAMQARGVPASFAGNLMMDALQVTGERFGVAPGERAVALLPGTRADAYMNARKIFEVVQHLAGKGLKFLLALAEHLDPEALAEATGWSFVRRSAEGGGFAAGERPLGSGAGAGGQPGLAGVFRKGSMEVLCVQGMFGDVLNTADVVIGLSGTGNEQAAGMGKPVVAFAGEGVQFTKGFAADQKRLLGEALSLVEGGPEAVAAEVERILGDPQTYARMAACGRERMGPPGAVKRVTAEIVRLVLG